MPSTDTVGLNPRPEPDSTPQRPVLPPNVSIFSPKDSAAAKALISGRLFSRITASTRTEPSSLARTLKKDLRVSQSFCLVHQNVLLVFDAAQGKEDMTMDVHHEHVRTVCLALKDANIGLDISGCVFDSVEALQAGFQLEQLSDGAVMVVDIMDGGDEDSDEDGLEALLKGGETTG